jgi:transglutaminase/protease-like cytokinesis protein 3
MFLHINNTKTSIAVMIVSLRNVIVTMKLRLIVLAMLALSVYQLRAQTAPKGTTTKTVATTKTAAATAPVAIAIPDSATYSVASLSRYLAAHTSTKKEYLQGLFNWITTNVTYDVKNMFEPNYYKDTADAVAKTLRTRTGVCFGYASLYQEVCRQGGITAYIVTGYTKKNGKIDNLAHAWNAIYIDNGWYFTDPTWGAGGVMNNQFVQQQNQWFFLQPPAVFIKTHMPYDPLWQLQPHPITQDEFAAGSWPDAASRPTFNYTDTLKAFNEMDEVAKYEHIIGRIRQTGITNPFTTSQVTYYQSLVTTLSYNRQVLSQNQVISQLNNCGNQFNEVVSLYNQYVNYKNGQFKAIKSDDQLRQIMSNMTNKLSASKAALQTMNTAVLDASMQPQVNQLRQVIGDMEQKLSTEQAFVDKYLNTSKIFRKTLFYKVG